MLDSIINVFFNSYENLVKEFTDSLFEIFKNFINLMKDNQYDNYVNENLCNIWD